VFLVELERFKVGGQCINVLEFTVDRRQFDAEDLVIPRTKLLQSFIFRSNPFTHLLKKRKEDNVS